MNTLEGVLRKEKIRLYSFPDIAALTNFPCKAYACSYIGNEKDGLLNVATEKKIPEKYLFMYGGKFIGIFSSVEVYGMGMRGSSDILCRITDIIRKHELEYKMTSVCERGIIFIMKREDAQLLYDKICAEFRISFG